MGLKYSITSSQREKAQNLGVIIKVSSRKKKKLDVYDAVTGEYIASIGDINYDDYYTYQKSEGLEYANARRRLYKIRHGSDIKVKTKAGNYTPGYLAYKLL